MKIAQPNKLPSLYDDKQPEKFSLPIYNIGLGTAKNIKIKWDFNEDFLQQTVLLDKDNDFFLENSIKQNGDKTLEIKGGQFNSLIRLNADLIQEIDFILPYKSDNDASAVLQIPYSIDKLFGIYVELCVKHKKLDELLKQNFSFDVDFKDVHNKKYTKRFNVKYNITYILDKKDVQGYIKIL
jgi:hypothetical protein